MRLAPLAMLIVACGRGAGHNSDSTTVVAGQTAAAVSSSGPGATGTVSIADAGQSACPATGAWASCNVFDRLDRAGLAPRRDSTVVTEALLTPPGSQILVGNAKLELYVYPDVRSREREQGKLDRAKYVSFDQPTMQSQPTLIYNTNLIALLFSRNDHLRERVSDAITAGPPQAPSQPTPKP
jgi:hypothetical protein